MADPLLEVRGLCVDYETDAGPVRAVDHVDLDIAQGEFVAIVGESGCGKSTLLFALTRLLQSPAVISEGSIRFRGSDMVVLGDAELRRLRWRDLSIVMQSAMNALNPTLAIRDQFGDALRAHGPTTDAEIDRRTGEVLRLVGIDPVHAGSYPHQLSGGMRQRAMIAMALLFEPSLIVMDEPTSALDVVAQRSLMSQIKALQARLGFAVLFVTHDMSLVSHYSDRLIVMYAGQVAEVARTAELFARPLHPYSQGLLGAFPSIRGPRIHLDGISGSPPDLGSPPTGCRFHPRCPLVFEPCPTVDPALYAVGDSRVRCLLYSPEHAPEATGTAARITPAASAARP